MITVKVYGDLKKVMKTSEFTLGSCHNLKHLFSALEANFVGFRKYLTDNAEKAMHIVLNNKTSVERSTLSMQNLNEGDVIHLVPIIEGSGDDWGSWASIIIGIILIYLSWGSNPTGWQMFGMGMGMSMVMSGVSQLLFKPEVIEPSTYEASDKSRANYAFNGAVNLTSQGNAVPVGYGRLRVGSQVIGAGLYAVNI